MKRILYYIGLLTIAIWLFTMHTAFAYVLNPLTNNNNFKYLFVFSGIDFKIYIPYCWGGTFAIAIVSIIANIKKTDKYLWHFAFTIATLELIGIALYIIQENSFGWKFISAIYYGIYGFFLTLFYFYVKYDAKEIVDKQDIAKPEIAPQLSPAINDEIMQLLKEGLSGVEISKQLNVHTSKVSRLKKKFNL
jgi:hypothetical protein